MLTGVCDLINVVSAREPNRQSVCTYYKEM
jgi:hypothetical protein